ncbi:hypothetical protein AB1N83_001671, partial [Pleurotus pulmonarius]
TRSLGSSAKTSSLCAICLLIIGRRASGSGPSRYPWTQWMKMTTPEKMRRRAVSPPTTGCCMLIVAPAPTASPTCRISSMMTNPTGTIFEFA